MELRHKLHYLGAATWTHTQLDDIGKQANARIEALETALERIVIEAEVIGGKCPPAPHACPACEILHVARAVQKGDERPPSCTAVPWASYMEIFPQSKNRIWVRWTGIDGIYRWLHPETRVWVEEPRQIEMPMFHDYATARKAADEAPEPPTWAEYSAKGGRQV